MARKLRTLIVGRARSFSDHGVFHRLSLIAFFAWVGLGADGLSSSCYGPPEAFLELGRYVHLGFFVALGTAVTILVISASYSQIIDLFPTGGGGYLVASKLLGPTAGMVSGCALLIDYALTITVSVASGADAVFSFLPPRWHEHKLAVALAGVAVLTVMNLRGVKESVIPLVPIFLVFVATHAFAIVYSIIANLGHMPDVVRGTAADVSASSAELGVAGMLVLILRAYSMGAGTYTGIEAVSNGLPILREPRVRTARHTMRYMAVSLAFTAMGLMIAYVLYSLGGTAQPGKTLNAQLFERMTSGWGASSGYGFVLVTLVSEAAILFVAAQTGFLDGPRVIANMALDRWFPSRLALLSERLVTQNGILLMGLAAFIVMAVSGGNVRFLVILYSINVFITITLSQLGMVRHWWQARKTDSRWRHSLAINGTGLVMSCFILVSVVSVKFHEGGWITLLITAVLACVAMWIRRQYGQVQKLLSRLDILARSAEASYTFKPAVTGEAAISTELPPQPLRPQYDAAHKTAVLMVNGFNGVGVHSMLNILRFFGDTFRNFVFVQVGIIDAGNFKGAEEVTRLKLHIKQELEKYVEFCRRSGYFADSFYAVAVDPLPEIDRLSTEILAKYPNAVFFGGQLVFPHDTMFSRWLYNAVVFAVQRRFYHRGIPFMILPIRMGAVT